MHVGQPRRKIPAAAVNNSSTHRHRDLSDRPDRDNLLPLHHDGVIRL